MWRACMHIKQVSKRKQVHVPNPSHVKFLMGNKFHIKQYLQNSCTFKLSSWKALLQKDNILFVPVLRANRWIGVVVWRNTTYNYIRVYDPNNATQTADEYGAAYAQSFLNFWVQIDTELSSALADTTSGHWVHNPWTLYRQHDVYTSDPTMKRSAFAVLARLWQVCKGEGFRRTLTREAVEDVEKQVQVYLGRRQVDSRYTLVDDR